MGQERAQKTYIGQTKRQLLVRTSIPDLKLLQLSLRQLQKPEGKAFHILHLRNVFVYVKGQDAERLLLIPIQWGRLIR
jgi:hypothetical protein